MTTWTGQSKSANPFGTAITYNGVVSGSTTTAIQTVTGPTVSAPKNCVLAFFNTNGNGDILTGVTANGVAMTKLGSNSHVGGEYNYLYYINDVSSGAVSITPTYSVTGNPHPYIIVCYDYVGVPTNYVSYTGSNSPITRTVTVTTPATSWAFSAFRNIDGNFSAGSGATMRGTASPQNAFDSNGVASSSPYSMTLTFPGTRQWGGFMCELPYASYQQTRNSTTWSSVTKN